MFLIDFLWPSTLTVFYAKNGSICFRCSPGPSETATPEGIPITCYIKMDLILTISSTCHAELSSFSRCQSIPAGFFEWTFCWLHIILMKCIVFSSFSLVCYNAACFCCCFYWLSSDVCVFAYFGETKYFTWAPRTWPSPNNVPVQKSEGGITGQTEPWPSTNTVRTLQQKLFGELTHQKQ